MKKRKGKGVEDRDENECMIKWDGMSDGEKEILEHVLCVSRCPRT